MDPIEATNGLSFRVGFSGHSGHLRLEPLSTVESSNPLKSLPDFILVCVVFRTSNGDLFTVISLAFASFFFCQSRNLFMFLRVWLNCDSVILILVVWLLKFCIILCFLMVILIAMLHRHACAFYCNCCSAIYVFKYFVPIPEFYWTLIGCLTRN